MSITDEEVRKLARAVAMLRRVAEKISMRSQSPMLLARGRLLAAATLAQDAVLTLTPVT